jgi:hypothetical protein
MHDPMTKAKAQASSHKKEEREQAGRRNTTINLRARDREVQPGVSVRVNSFCMEVFWRDSNVAGVTSELRKENMDGHLSQTLLAEMIDLNDDEQMRI